MYNSPAISLTSVIKSVWELYRASLHAENYRSASGATWDKVSEETVLFKEHLYFLYTHTISHTDYNHAYTCIIIHIIDLDVSECRKISHSRP